MGSTRLPGKVLAELAGKPVLQWVVEAARKIQSVDHVVVATTERPEDAEIQVWCERFEVDCFRGDADDVLGRYLDCANFFEATQVVRITADCPLLDHEVSERVVRSGIGSAADYFFLDGEFPDGLDTEGFTIEALNTAHRRANLKSDREHVTSYFRTHPQEFQTKPVEILRSAGNVRLTLDHPEDLQFLEKLVRGMQRNGRELSVMQILNYLSEHPNLTKVNDMFTRNAGYYTSLIND